MLNTDESEREQPAKRGELCLGVVDGRSADEKFELVWNEKQPGNPCLELRRIAWDEGLGWYRQQTLALPNDLAVFDGLIHQARRLMSRCTRRSQTRGKVLAFRLSPGRPQGD